MTQVLRDTARRTAMKVVARPESHGLAVVHDDQSISVSAIYSEALRNDHARLTVLFFFINEYHSELHHSLHCTITNALGEQGVLAVRIQENTADSQMAASSLPYCTYMINTVL